MDIKLSFLGGLSRYQENLIEIIKELREYSWTYKDISTHLISKGYRSTRDKELSPQLVERMYKKYLKKIERENYIEIYLTILLSRMSPVKPNSNKINILKITKNIKNIPKNRNSV